MLRPVALLCFVNLFHSRIKSELTQRSNMKLKSAQTTTFGLNVLQSQMS